MLNWTKAQWEAFGRHIITMLASVFATLVFMNVIKAEDAAQIMSSATQLITALAGLAAVVVPVISGIWASRSASPERQVAQTVANLTSGAPLSGEKKKKLIEALAEQPEIKKVVVADPELAEIIPSEKVTSL